MVVSAPTGSGKTVVFEMAIVQLLMEIDHKKYQGDFKIIYSKIFYSFYDYALLIPILLFL